ncbi:ribosomal small subunit pseudouridine synthase A [Clostridium cavendishii DSM 21758]|uniref:Pseudouridine synthase n=1 Tax=Clostridium cavendishii DSM 21758 TaxID=1121302 RepID=A0A1M6LFZ2_9CLOT|nr:pseudouridine synthase [Clostridium cavendishii]SHJ70161.1 ribosomal small subunit pseudouridine synthase A [Clostridium cavendishii DSM 21758]
MERLDKVLSNLGYGTRKELKQIIKKGYVKVNNIIVKDNGLQIDPEKDIIHVNDEEVIYREFIYLMMNKPDGVISATFDNRDETVIDLLCYEHQVFEPFPVGRLDKDTVGLLLLTNDGDLNHKLISPKWHVDKVYYAEINMPIDEADIKAFKDGVILDDGYKCMEAELEIIENLQDSARVKVTVQEGKYHQVKRMFESRGKKVVYLKRTNFGNLALDESLEEGEYRELTQEELDILYSNWE